MELKLREEKAAAKGRDALQKAFKNISSSFIIFISLLQQLLN